MKIVTSRPYTLGIPIVSVIIAIGVQVNHGRAVMLFGSNFRLEEIGRGLRKEANRLAGTEVDGCDGLDGSVIRRLFLLVVVAAGSCHVSDDRSSRTVRETGRKGTARESANQLIATHQDGHGRLLSVVHGRRPRLLVKDTWDRLFGSLGPLGVRTCRCRAVSAL